MEKSAKGLVIRLVLMTGVASVCPLLTLVMEVYTDYRPTTALAVCLLFLLTALPYLLFFLLCLVILPCTAWRGVVAHGMKKMEAWWWVSVPHTVVFGLYSLLPQVARFSAHVIPFFSFSG